jgi:molybdopterin/thiamine biosynthesis adenylyltransferase
MAIFYMYGAYSEVSDCCSFLETRNQISRANVIEIQPHIDPNTPRCKIMH